MIRINLLLLVAVVLCAMSVVDAQYRARRAFAALDVAQQRAEQLGMDKDRLQVEERTMSAPGRIEQLARSKLGMQPITPARTLFVPAGQSMLPPVPPVMPPEKGAGKGRG